MDGHPLHTSINEIRAGRTRYIVHTWTGCILSTNARVVRVMSTGTYTELINSTAHEKVLVLDTDPSAAVAVANYTYRRQQHKHPPVMHNLDVATNANVASVYLLYGGTIPPDHPLDYAPHRKLMYWCNDFDEMLATTSLLFVNRVVVYMNSGLVNVQQIAKCIRQYSIDCVCTPDEMLYYGQKDLFENVDNCYLYRSLVIGGGGGHPDEDAQRGIYRSIFEQDYKPYHSTLDSSIQGYELMPASLIPFLTKGGAIDRYRPLKQLYTSMAVYAMVSGAKTQALATFVGFVLLQDDLTKKMVSLFSESDIKKNTLLYACYLQV